MLGELVALPVTLTRSAMLVPGMVNQAAGVLDDVARIVAAVDELVDVARGTLSRVQHTAEAASTLPKRVSHIIEASEALPGQAVHAARRDRRDARSAAAAGGSTR